MNKLNNGNYIRSRQKFFHSALAFFLAIGSKLRTEQLYVPFFVLKESLLLSFVSVEMEKPMEDFTLVLDYGSPIKLKLVHEKN